VPGRFAFGGNCFSGGFDGAAADFIDSLLAGRQPAQDIKTAKHILQVPLAIYEASRLGRAVSPDSIK